MSILMAHNPEFQMSSQWLLADLKYDGGENGSLWILWTAALQHYVLEINVPLCGKICLRETERGITRPRPAPHNHGLSPPP